MPGTLFLVATPIGNLEDMTLRALRILREVAVIAAEDTRRTARLLTHYGISTPTLSLHEHNERSRLVPLLTRLESGDSVALVTDAGTPLVSDPGADLVRAAREAGIRVEAVPGASAVLTALVASGLGGESFTFLGFPPSRSGERLAWLRRVAAEPHTCVFFEAPHRIRQTLGDLAEVLPDRPLAVTRELTKVHEEILTGTATTVLARLTDPRGEFTVVLSAPIEIPADPLSISPADLWREFCSLTADTATGRREAIAVLARRYGRPAREIYAAVEQGRAAGSDG